MKKKNLNLIKEILVVFNPYTKGALKTKISSEEIMPKVEKFIKVISKENIVVELEELEILDKFQDITKTYLRKEYKIINKMLSLSSDELTDEKIREVIKNNSIYKLMDNLNIFFNIGIITEEEKKFICEKLNLVLENNEKKELERKKSKQESIEKNRIRARERNAAASMPKYVFLINEAYNDFLNGVSFIEIKKDKKYEFLKNNFKLYISKKADVLSEQVSKEAMGFTLKLCEFWSLEVQMKFYRINPEWFEYKDEYDLFTKIYPANPETLKRNFTILKENMNVTPELNQIYNFDYVLSVYTKYYNLYKAKENEIKENERRVKEYNLALETITDFMEFNFTEVKEFCRKIKITSTAFYKCVELLKRMNDPLYVKYQQYMADNELTGDKLQKDISELKKVVYLINNGIIEGASIRRCDVLDYFTVTSLTEKDIKKIYDKIDVADYRTLKRFFQYNDICQMEEIDINIRIRNCVDRVNARYDSYGNYIMDSGILIDNEMKEKIIELLKKNNIPVNCSTYRVARNRILNGKEIFDYEGIEKTLGYFDKGESGYQLSKSKKTSNQ